MNRSKSGLFLIEIMIALLFFSFGIGLCIQIFMLSLNTTTHSKDLSSAVVAAQSAAEIYELGGVELLIELTDATLINEEYHTSFNDDGCYSNDAEYKAVFIETKTGNLALLSIQLFNEEQLLYDLETARYTAK